MHRILGPRRTAFVSLAIVLTAALVAGWLMGAAFSSAREAALERLGFQAEALARQAAAGMVSYFDYQYNALSFLAGLETVSRLDEGGKALMAAYVDSQRGDLSALTRVGADGRVVWSWPDASVVGREVLAQDHNRRLFSSRRPALSSVFRTVQGYDAVALAMPVFAGAEFAGALTALIPFERIAERFVKDIRIADSGYAVLIDAAGIELYCPAREHIGRNVRETSADSPSFLALVEKMGAGGSGSGSYVYQNIADRRLEAPLVKVARYEAVPLLDTFWTVLVTVPEDEAYAFMIDFRDRWLALATLLIGAALLSLALIARSGARVAALNEGLEFANASLNDAMEGLETAQKRLVVSEKLATLGQLAASVGHQLNSPLAAIASASGTISWALGGGLAAYAAAVARLGEGDRRALAALVSAGIEAAGSEPEPADARSRRKALRDELEAAGAARAPELARTIEALGLAGRWREFDALALRDDAVELFGLALSLADAEKAAGVVGEATERASAVVKALAAYVRGESEERGPCDISEQLKSVAALYGPGKRGSSVSLGLELEPGCAVVGASEELLQVWANLLSNALQAVGQAGRVVMRCRRDGGAVEVEVEDDGHGIAPSVAERVFEPFFTTKAHGEGTGLGLDIAKRIAESHGGSIRFESEPGRTVFRVSLPAAGAPSP